MLNVESVENKGNNQSRSLFDAKKVNFFVVPSKRRKILENSVATACCLPNQQG